MKILAQAMNDMRAQKSIGVMTHVVIGYPSLADSERMVMQMAEVGVDCIELQIPFSDPIADGPTIMMANDQALAQGVSIGDCLQFMRRVSKRVAVPLLFMGYFNSLYSYGVKRFCQEAQIAGAQGLIFPDIPLDEEPHEHFIQSSLECDLAPIRMLSPTSTDQRIAENIKIATGFVYCTAVSGTTGTNKTLGRETQQFLRRMKKATNLPLAVGFGLSEPDHVRSLIGFGDMAVVGSAVIRKIEENGVVSVQKFVQTLVEAGR